MSVLEAIPAEELQAELTRRCNEAWRAREEDERRRFGRTVAGWAKYLRVKCEARFQLDNANCLRFREYVDQLRRALAGITVEDACYVDGELVWQLLAMPLSVQCLKDPRVRRDLLAAVHRLVSENLEGDGI